MAAIVEPEQQLPPEFEAQNSSVLQMALAALRLTALNRTVDLTGVFTRKRITLDEVANHDHRGSCWIVVYDRVYDITRFLREHPGGDDLLLEYAGRDASLAFRGTGHTEHAVQLLKNYEIGELPPHECIFRCKNGLKLSNNLPD